MQFRNSVVFVHRWLALVAGVFWSVAALTGGVLVFETELDRWINGGRFEVSGGELPPGGLDRALAENFPGETVRSMAWLHEDHVLRITMQGETDRRLVFVDAGTGREVENIRPRRSIVGAIRRAHTSLFAGKPGYWLVTAASAAVALSLLTGLYLWWPGIRSLARGFVVRMKRGAYILNFDLHQMLGAVTFVLLFAMTGTGVIMGLPRAGPTLGRILLSETPEPPATAESAPAPPAQVPPPGIEALAATAEQAAGGRIVNLAYLDGEPARVEVRVRSEGAGGELAIVTLARADGRVLDVFDSSRWSSEQRFGSFLSQWHTGGFNSLWVRILFAAACFAGAVIAATGFVVWWIKRRRKLDSQQKRAESAAV